ncbi:MAG: PHP domain-containing protein [Erysipelotrichaceae bacterium]|nr:PHP domain-containing protein [Erysipelotrichaceae bacterium]
MNNVDLHIHSIYSDDGQYQVKELLDIAKANEIALLSITDHDRALANHDALSMIKDYDMSYLTGIEISCQYQGIDLHVLGYGIDHLDPIWEKRFSKIVKNYNDIFHQVVAKLNDHLNVEIDADYLIEKANGNMVNGEMVCSLLLEDDHNRDHPILKEYFPGGNRSDMPLVNFFWDLMAQGKPAYVPLQEVTVLDEAIKMIKDTGGFAVLAHPGQNFGYNDQIVRDIMKEKVDGIEVFTSYHDQKQIAFYKDLALELDCLITGGSDFHGNIKPNIKMKQHHGQIEKEQFLHELKIRKLI